MSYFDTIYADHLLPHRARTVYMYLRDRGDAQQKCWPSIKTIAGCPSKYGTQFVTWDRDFDHKGVSHGHYYTGLYASGNYEAAKRDFATRSGLIPEPQVFREEQLVEIYRCCKDTLQNDTALSYKREKAIQEVQEQIEQCLSDIAERIQQQEAEPTQEQTM